MHEASKHPSGDTAGTAAGKKMPEGRRFSGDYAREMGKRRAQKGLDKATASTVPDMHLVVPVELAPVIEALRDKAKTGNPQAAREYLAYLTRFQPQSTVGIEDLEVKALEDMTPDELAFAEAWALRQVARAQRKLQGLKGTFALDHTAAQDGKAPPK
jgi:hypothetical protein